MPSINLITSISSSQWMTILGECLNKITESIVLLRRQGLVQFEIVFEGYGTFVTYYGLLNDSFVLLREVLKC